MCFLTYELVHQTLRSAFTWKAKKEASYLKKVTKAEKQGKPNPLSGQFAALTLSSARFVITFTPTLSTGQRKPFVSLPPKEK